MGWILIISVVRRALLYSGESTPAFQLFLIPSFKVNIIKVVVFRGVGDIQVWETPGEVLGP
jgi:hypothetical protein